MQDAEQQYLTAVAIEPKAVIWSTLGSLYHREGQLPAEIDAWEHAAAILPHPGLALLSLGYANLDAHRPRQALQALDRAATSLPPQPATSDNNSFLANVAHGRALGWSVLGNLHRAIFFEEETVRLAPDRSDDWTFLANLYERNGQLADARQARQRAAASRLQQPSSLQP